MLDRVGPTDPDYQGYVGPECPDCTGPDMIL